MTDIQPIKKVLNISREELVLRRLFDDPIVQNRVLPHIDAELFSDDADQKICGAILSYFKKYQRFPARDDLPLGLPSNSLEKNKLMKILNYDLDNISTDVAVDIIETFFKEKKTEKILIEAAESINQRDFKNISGMIEDLGKAVNFSLHMDIGLDLVEDAGEALRRLMETHVPIPSALADVRAWTHENRRSGGWYRGSLSVFVGMPNVGKTLQLCNEAAYSFQAGYNVLYVTLELVAEGIWEKIAVNVSGIPLTEIRKVYKREGEEAIKDALRDNTQTRSEMLQEYVNENVDSKGSLTVRQLPSTTTAFDIENLMNEIKIAKGVTIDIVFIDYLQKMKPAKQAGSLSNATLYTQGKEVSEQVRDLAIKYEIPVVTASQLNRDGYSNKQADMANTAGSAAINDTADVMITITEDPYLKKNAMFLHMITKNRFGPNMIVFLSQCNWSLMRVRSADNEQIVHYRETQVNQTVEIANFNRDKRDSTAEAIPKVEKPVVVEKTSEEKERDRFASIKKELEKHEPEPVKEEPKIDKIVDAPEEEPILKTNHNFNNVEPSPVDRWAELRNKK